MNLSTEVLLAQAALSFQSAEYFGLGLIGLSCITSIGAKNQTKAVVSVMIGLMIGTIGIDSINGVERFAFEQPSLLNGINYISVMIGAFAVAEVYKNIEEFRHVDTSLRTEQKVKIKLMKFSEMAKMWSSFIRGSIIGTIIGIIPAAGGSIASLIAYGATAIYPYLAYQTVQELIDSEKVSAHWPNLPISPRTDSIACSTCSSDTRCG